VRNSYKFLSLLLMVFFYGGCATAPLPEPLTYLALEKPRGVIRTQGHQEVKKTFSRGGFYFFNYNFRPSADIKRYVEETSRSANAPVLKNADIQLQVPFAFDILLFGYNNGTDTVTAK